MKNNNKISVVIPTLNEIGNIGKLVKAIVRVLYRNNFEIIIVDDNSSDGTQNAIKKISQKIKYIRCVVRKKNPGLGLSILEGILKAKGNIIIGMDADFNHDPKVLHYLISSLENKENKLAVASRFVKGGGMKNQYRYWTSLIFNLLLKYWFGFPILDNTSGYYAIRKNDLEKMGLKKIYYGYGDYHLRLVFLAKINKLKLIEVPVYYPDRKSGQSKSNFKKMFFSYLNEAHRLSKITSSRE